MLESVEKRMEIFHSLCKHLLQILMSVLLEECVTRMQSVWTQQAAMSVPAPLATLVMDTHVWTLTSV